jgi:ADP-ribose pyrophosphatase YjhB (NUDIX family)
MLSSRKSEGVFRLPRGNCDGIETPEQAMLRVLHDEAGVQVDEVTQRVGTYTEANKKGKIVGHHWIYEVKNPVLLDSWPALDRKRVWVSFIFVLFFQTLFLIKRDF